MTISVETRKKEEKMQVLVKFFQTQKTEGKQRKEEIIKGFRSSFTF